MHRSQWAELFSVCIVQKKNYVSYQCDCRADAGRSIFEKNKRQKDTYIPQRLKNQQSTFALAKIPRDKYEQRNGGNGLRYNDFTIYTG